MSRLFYGIVLIVFFFFVTSCATKQEQDTVQNQSASQPKTNLSKENVIKLANAEAVSRGYKLENYETPKVEYTKYDETWTVFYDGEAKVPGNIFFVDVNDKTEECKFGQGE